MSYYKEMREYTHPTKNTKNVIGTLKADGAYTVPAEDTLKELANKHYPTHTSKKKTIYPDTSINKVELESRYNDWINEERNIAAFKGFESKKSLGPDSIKQITLKHLPISMIKKV